MRSALILHEDLYELFRERVDTAAEHRGRPISEEGEWYLADLLADRGTTGQEPPPTLAELALRAARGDPAAAVESLRELGDEALYVSGFQRRALARSRVGLDYYLEMGALAYERLSRLLRAPSPPGDVEGRALDAIFEELARTFDACSDILREVQQSLFGGAAGGSLDGAPGGQ